MPLLHDGREVASDSADWRIETLARHVLALGSRSAMEQWLSGFAEKHKGTDADGKLRACMNAVREAAKRHPKVTQNVSQNGLF